MANSASRDRAAIGAQPRTALTVIPGASQQEKDVLPGLEHWLVLHHRVTIPIASVIQNASRTKTPAAKQ